MIAIIGPMNDHTVPEFVDNQQLHGVEIICEVTSHKSILRMLSSGRLLTQFHCHNP